jgi:hypothetical protein
VPSWSSTANWVGGTAPSGKVATLTFPALTSSECTAIPRTAECYESKNDLTGLEAEALSIDDGVEYFISGNGISLGAGGLTAAPSANDCAEFCSPTIALPMTLAASQTWTITAGIHAFQLSVGSVTGTTSNLNVNFSPEPFLSLNGPVEVGTFTASGHGFIGLFGSLNGTDGKPVGLSGGAGLFVPFGGSTIGPLTATEANVSVGQGFAPDATLAVNGGVTLSSSTGFLTYIDHAGTTPGTDYSQVSASEAVNLGGAHLTLALGAEEVAGEFPCAKLKRGDVDTLITTTGSLTGTFAGIPDEAVVPFSFCAGEGSGENLGSVRINYTAHAVTATILETADEKQKAEEAAAKKAAEEAAAKKKAEEEAAAKKKAEEAAAKKAAEEAAARKAAEEAAAKKAAEEAAAKKKAEEAAKAVCSVSLQSSTLAVRGNKAAVKLAASGIATCTGKLTLIVKVKGKNKHAKKKTIGTATFSVTGGKAVIVRINLSGPGRALLKGAHGHLSGTLTILKASPNPATTQTQGVRLAKAKK